jgi:hypothetical protein
MTVRRPILSANARGKQNRSRLSVGQVPAADDKREDEPDQIKVEEVQHVADRCRGEDLPLVRRQRFLSLQLFEHRFLPGLSFIIFETEQISRVDDTGLSAARRSI